MSFEIPREEVENMGPEDFVGTFTYDSDGSESWIQRNEMADEYGDLWGLMVLVDGKVLEYSGWHHSNRNIKNRKHYWSLEDLVQDCDDEELLDLFLKEI